VAFGADHKAPAAALLQRVAAAGYRPPFLVENEVVIAGYVTDPEREIEIATAPPELAAMLGWEPVWPFLTQL